MREVVIRKNILCVQYIFRPQPEPPKRAEAVDVRAGGEPQELINGEREEQHAAPAEGNESFAY